MLHHEHQKTLKIKTDGVLKQTYFNRFYLLVIIYNLDEIKSEFMIIFCHVDYNLRSPGWERLNQQNHTKLFISFSVFLGVQCTYFEDLLQRKIIIELGKL